MYNMTDVELLITEHIKGMIEADAALHRERNYIANTYCIITHHIERATLLTSSHPMYGTWQWQWLRNSSLIKDCGFQEQIQEIPSFAVDVLVAVKATSKTVTRGGYNP
jgi:hypothetical protein